MSLVVVEQAAEERAPANWPDVMGRRSLVPAFDLTYSFKPNGSWTHRHQMGLNGKRDGFELEDFKAVADTSSMKRGRAEASLSEVTSAVRRWHEFAEQGGH